MKEKNYPALGPYQTVGKWLDGAKPLAQAIKTELDKKRRHEDGTDVSRAAGDENAGHTESSTSRRLVSSAVRSRG